MKTQDIIELLEKKASELAQEVAKKTKKFVEITNTINDLKAHKKTKYVSVNMSKLYDALTDDITFPQLEKME